MKRLLATIALLLAMLLASSPAAAFTDDASGPTLDLPGNVTWE